MRIEDVYIWDINAKWLGISPYQLMENAGAGVAKAIDCLLYTSDAADE